MIVNLEGIKEHFISKSGIDKFKTFVKNNINDLNMEEINKKYIKPEYKLEILSKTDEEIKFKTINLVELQSIEHKKMLKAKLKLLTGKSNVYSPKANVSIPPDILKEYLKLKNMSKMPIPEPGEICANKEEYKPIIQMVLGNDMMKTLGNKHPYKRYFTLLAEHLGLEINNTNQNEENVEPITINNNIKSSDLHDAETDTDSED
jgi:hypothetical protein